MLRFGPSIGSGNGVAACGCRLANGTDITTVMLCHEHGDLEKRQQRDAVEARYKPLLEAAAAVWGSVPACRCREGSPCEQEGRHAHALNALHAALAALEETANG